MNNSNSNIKRIELSSYMQEQRKRSSYSLEAVARKTLRFLSFQHLFSVMNFDDRYLLLKYAKT